MWILAETKNIQPQKQIKREKREILSCENKQDIILST